MVRSRFAQSRHRAGLGGSRVYAAIVLVTAALTLPLSNTAAEAHCSQRVYVYSADWCGTCRQLRAYLDRNRIRYTLLDATTPRVQADMLARFGNTAVPRTLIGRSVVSGFDPAQINQLCR